MNGQNLTKFCIHIIIDKIYVEIVKRHFSQICYRVTALDWRQNWVLAQYLENEYTELTQNLYTQKVIINTRSILGFVKRHFFAILQQSCGHWLTPEFGFC